MIIKIADHYGICFGVRDALRTAELLAHAPLTILGEIVHNPVVRERMAAAGADERPLDQPGSANTAQVMITAHGASDAAKLAWLQAGFAVADGTCPLVRRAHEELSTLVREGYFPVVIGKRGHVEVNGLVGDFPEAVVIETARDFADLPIEARYGVISQTTQRLDSVGAIISAMRVAYPEAEVRFCDTICKPTKDRQSALERLLAEVEVMVVVGGHNSNNTRELLVRCEAFGLRAYHVERSEDLRREWFAGVRVVGLTAGTSTLPETVQAVRERMESFEDAL